MKPSPLSEKASSAFCKKLRELRKNLNLPSNAALARFIGEKERTVAAWLSKQNRVTAEAVSRVEARLESKLVEIDREVEAIEHFVGRSPAIK